MTTTLVTGFFNIKNVKDATTLSRPLEFYLENAKYTLSQPFPMIIFCDPTLHGHIMGIRDRECPDNQTIYVEKNITEYETWNQCKSIIIKNREGDPQYINSRNTPSYLLVTSFKYQAIKMAYDMNPWKTSHFAWIDFGGGHVCKDMAEYLPEIVRNPGPKVSMLYIHYRSAADVADMKKYMRGGPCSIAGNFWTVEGSYVDRFYLATQELFYKQLYEGVGHNDEQTLSFIHARYPDLFRFYWGDYSSVYSNYYYVRKDYGSVRWHYIQNALNAGDRNAAREAAQNVVQSCDKGFMNLAEEEKNFLRGI